MIVAPIASEIYEARQFMRDEQFLAQSKSLGSIASSQHRPTSREDVTKQMSTTHSDGASGLTVSHQSVESRSKRRLSFVDDLPEQS